MEIKTNNTLALKYRPRKFEDLAGHADIVTGLKGMLKSQELPNAYAIVGLSGTGKTTIGRMIARYLNCETQTGCGKCQSCKEMDAGANMDYTEINASESGNIETVRKQIEAANFKPRYNVRVILWDECIPAGYKVLMADGTERNIEDITDGSSVLSYNTNTDVNEPNKVSNVFSRPSDTLLKFTMEDGSTFECTPTHKMWSNDRQEYVEARHLKVGEDFLCLPVYST